MSVALLITCEGAVVEIDLPESSKERGAVYRAVLRCEMFDVVPLTSRLDMWLDDEGVYRHPVNALGTVIARRYGYTSQPYHGPVLLTGGADEDGDTLPLTRDQMLAILSGLASLTD